MSKNQIKRALKRSKKVSDFGGFGGLKTDKKYFPDDKKSEAHV